MILDLIVILLVVILSFLFCINNDKINKKNCQLTHIVLGLTVIVFYKLVKYYKVNEKINKNQNINNKNNNNNNMFSNKEKFTVSDSINDFITNSTYNTITEDSTKLDNAQLIDYTQKISELTDQIKILNANSSSNNNGIKTSNTTDAINLESQQALQQFQIDYLAKQVKNAQDIINASQVSNSSQNYKPIKIFSSCVANADGTLTAEQPVKDSFQSLQPLESVSNSNASNIINNTSSQSPLNIANILSSLIKK
jgi:hypothetical protein